MPTCACQPPDRRIPGLLLNNAVRRLFSPPERFLSKYVEVGETAADIGCGAGFFTLPMAKIVGRAGRVHAVDFDPKAIEQLKRRADRGALGEIIASHSASASDVDFIESGSVDFVLAEGLLCCMKDHEGAVRQIRRILKPTGRAYVSVMKFAHRDDPRGVSPDEWSRILATFRVLDAGESFFMRWALLEGNGNLPRALDGRVKGAIVGGVSRY